ncbi:hypothetical protein T06_631 [Trichinella sp. T6]|nr:hypothetical protein T06_631 [Trichinella sp. T6]
MDNDLMLNNRLKECGTEKIVTLKDVMYEALLSFHDEINKVNHVCSEDHLSPLIPLKFGSKRRIDAVGNRYQRSYGNFENARDESEGIQTLQISKLPEA